MNCYIDGKLQPLNLSNFNRLEYDQLLNGETVKGVTICNPSPEPATGERALFEAAAWHLHTLRNPDNPGSPQQLLWRTADGTYGVLMFNAAWWGWQASQKAVR